MDSSGLTTEQHVINGNQYTDNRHYSLFFTEDDSLDNELHEESREFYRFIRAHVIYFVTILILYALSCSLISYFSKRNDEFRVDIEEYRTYKISTWMCAFTLAISIAAFLLLPVSITTNELTWIDDSQTKWSLLDGMWSYVFLFSNLSLFVLLPFAYFFTESEGFSGSRRGLLSRLRETCVVLMIVAITVLGLTYTVCCLFFGLGCYVSNILTIWQYLPFLYSCISFIGALLLLLCTPLGISHLFTVLREMDTIQKVRKLSYAALFALMSLAAYSIILVSINLFQVLVGFRSLPLSSALNTLASNANQIQDQDSSLDDLIEQQKQLASNAMADRDHRRSGPIGAFLDIVMILYLWSASLCGLYNLPRLCCLRPRKHKCSFNQILGNCTLLCLLSSALPLLSRILGLTNFDLLADYGRIEWLGNYYVVLSYNAVFLISTTLCLSGKRELVLTINLFKAVIGNPHQSRLSRRNGHRNTNMSDVAKSPNGDLNNDPTRLSDTDDMNAKQLSMSESQITPDHDSTKEKED